MDQLIEAYQVSWFFHSREGLSLTRDQGESIPVNVSVSRIHTQPKPIGLVVARDISERKRAQETLDHFFQLAPDLFAILKKEESGIRFLKINRAWETFAGYSIDDLIKMSPWSLVHVDDVKSAQQAIETILKGSELNGFELRLQLKDESYRWLSCNASASNEHIYLVARDLSEEKRAQALRRAMEAVELASRAKSEFLASISHEIRTPMAAILDYTDLALTAISQPKKPDDLREDLQVIRRNAEHMLELLGDLLDLSRIEAGSLRVQHARCSPMELLGDAMRVIGPLAVSKGLNLEIKYLSPIPETIFSDPTRLKQILINLLNNAVKFTRQGSVRVHVELLEQGPAGSQLLFGVIDTGIGMTFPEASRLFTPFHSVRPDDPSQPSGAGLGLAISGRLAQLLGGRINVLTTPGKGSKFILALPTGPLDGVRRVDQAEAKVKKPDDPQPTPPPASPAPATPGSPSPKTIARVLLAEDHDDMRRAMIQLLQQSRFEVVAVKDGHAAVETALKARDEGRPFDAILMDMRMPKIDGYEATRQLRDQGLTTLIIALTAYASTEDREECLSIGCNEHFSKPITDWGRLLDLIAAQARTSTS